MDDAKGEAAGAGARPADALIAALIGGVFLALYVSTLAPDLALGGGDGHELTVVAATLGLAHPTGYPLYTWIGHLFTTLPIGTVAYRTNLMSATLGAGAVAMLYLIARKIRLPPVSAAYAAVTFGISTTFWSQAVITEVYAPNAFMVSLTLWLLLRWAAAVGSSEAAGVADRRFLGFALAYGLSLGSHMSNLGFAPAYAMFVLVCEWRILMRPVVVLLGLAAFLLGVAQFAWLPLRMEVLDIFPNPHPGTLDALLDYTVRAFSNLRFSFPLAALPGRMAVYQGMLEDNFTKVGLGLGLLGMWTLLHRDVRRFWLLAGMYGVHVGFFSQLFVPDPDVFFIASNLVFALFVGLGIDAVRAATARLVTLGPPSGVGLARAVSLAVVLLLYVPLAGAARESLRDNDRSKDTAYGDFYRNVFDVLPRGSVLVPKGRGAFASAVTYWRRINGVRPDLVVLTDRGATAPPTAPMFVAHIRTPLGVHLPTARLAPVLRAAGADLVLYRIEPGGRSPEDGPPSGGVERDLGVATLVHVDVVVSRRRRPARVHLRALWRRGDDVPQPVIATRVDDETIETHVLGDGLPPPATDARGTPIGAEVVEDYDVVVPSTLPSGSHALMLGTVDLGSSGVKLRWVEVGSVVIE